MLLLIGTNFETEIQLISFYHLVYIPKKLSGHSE